MNSYLLETVKNNTQQISTINELESKHRGYFFTEDSMSFFNSIVYPFVLGGCVFVTSERDKTGGAWSGKRRYTVRAIDEYGQIVSGEFGQFATQKAAINYAKKITQTERKVNK